MGYYIQGGGAQGKTRFLVTELGGKQIPQPRSFDDIPADKALIVVVNNGPFQAAGLIFSPAEFKAFTLPSDYRDKEFVLVDRETAHDHAGYDPLIDGQ